MVAIFDTGLLIASCQAELAPLRIRCRFGEIKKRFAPERHRGLRAVALVRAPRNRAGRSRRFTPLPGTEICFVRFLDGRADLCRSDTQPCFGRALLGLSNEPAC